MRGRWSRRRWRAASVLLVALTITVAARPEPVISGPRPPVERGSAIADRTVPPLPHVDERFATLPYHDTLGRPGTWVLAETAKPLQMTVERELAQRFGLEALGRALEQWNGTPGSDFTVMLTGITDAGVDRKLRDGVNRVFLDRRECGERFLARAHLHTAEVEERDGRPVVWVTEVDIGVCERMPAELLGAVMRHELAHVAGVGHLCDPGEECWTPQMGEDNRCRLMATAAYECQAPTPADEEALAYLHPRLPRVAGNDEAASVAAVSALAFPHTGAADRVLLTDADAPLPLRAAAAALAGVERIPHLYAGDVCTEGVGGAELNRVAGIGATVVLVGAIPGGCEDALRLGWELEVERLPDVAAVTRAVADAAPTAPTRVVVVPAGDPDRAGVPAAALAVPVAVGLSAPLLVLADGELDDAVRAAIDAVPTITGVVLLEAGSPIDVLRLERLERLETETGIRVRRIAASDGVELAFKISRMRDVFPRAELAPVLVATDRTEDAAAAAHLAAATRQPVVPVFTGAGSPDVRLAEYLAERADGGFVVGGHAALSSRLQVRLSRAVDGVR